MDKLTSHVQRAWAQAKPLAAAAAAIAAFYLALGAAGIGCPIKFLTGVSCAGCGMTRAWLALLAGNPAEAFFYHPLFPVPLLYCLALLGRSKMSRRQFGIITWVTVALFVVVYVFRMTQPDTVVVFRPEDGAVFRALGIFQDGGLSHVL